VDVRGLVTIAVLLSGIGAAAQEGTPWREATAYRPLLAPPGDRGSAYRFYVSPLDLEAILTLLRADPALVRTPGAWEARPTAPLDAFGQAGVYDRSAMVRVYGARQPRVARGARREGNQVVESWILISPYPDAPLRRLEAGTLLVVLRLP
jgi:hypothetical protein